MPAADHSIFHLAENRPDHRRADSGQFRHAVQIGERLRNRRAPEPRQTDKDVSDIRVEIVGGRQGPRARRLVVKEGVIASVIVPIHGEKIEDRARFLLEVIQEIQSRIGKEFPLIVKVSGQDHHNDAGIWPRSAGNDIDDAIAISKMVYDLGVHVVFFLTLDAFKLKPKRREPRSQMEKPCLRRRLVPS